MNRWPLYLSLFFSMVVFTVNPVMAKDSIKVISPPNLASVSGKLINFIYRVEENSFDTIKLTNDSYSTWRQPEPVVKFNVHHNRIFLTGGKNIIRIQGLKGEEVAEEKIFTVFLRSKLEQKYYMTPAGFQEYNFHTPENEKSCSFCHIEDLQAGAKSKQNQTLPACYTCHKRIVDYKFVHGPASVWACDTCHKEDQGTNKNAVPDPEVIACRMCHTEELALWKSKQFGHGPTLAGNCAQCHNPHASDEKFFLHSNPTDLCRFCHEDKLRENHIITGFSQRGHPIKQKGGKNGKKSIYCASCHNPHGANNKNLLIGYKNSRMEMCRRCHR